MAQIIMIHSFRRGVGRTLLAANLATALAQLGHNVGMIDTDLELPELHLSLQIESASLARTLNDALWKGFPIDQAVVNLKAALSNLPGKLVLLPADSRPEVISATRRTPLEMSSFGNILDQFIESQNLDFVVMDSSAGLDEKTMALLALADTLLVILRPDQQEYQGTALLVDIGRKLNIPRVFIVTNEVNDNLDRTSIRNEVKRVFNAECAAILPFNDFLPLLGKENLLLTSQPENPVAIEIIRLANFLSKE